MKKNVIRVILIVLLFDTFCIIFNFSNQDGEKSSGVSKKVTEIIVKNVLQIPEDAKEEMIENLQPIVRKLAHFSIYTAVGFLLMALASTYKIKEKKGCYISLGIGILYASLDEFHQSFIPGRSARVMDVLIDTIGVIVGMCVVVILLKIRTRKKHKSVEK